MQFKLEIHLNSTFQFTLPIQLKPARVRDRMLCHAGTRGACHHAVPGIAVAKELRKSCEGNSEEFERLYGAMYCLYIPS